MLSQSVLRCGFYAFLPLLMLFSGCSGGESGGGGAQPMTSVGIQLSPAKATAKSESSAKRNAVKTETITVLTIDVKDARGNELARQSANIEPGTTVTLTLNVPVGANRVFKAEAFDAKGQVILFGDAVTDLQEGTPVTVSIPVEAPVVLSPENPIIDTNAMQTFTVTRSRIFKDPLQWTVDGIVNGNDQVGTITPTDDSTAEYTAPATVPGAGQVAVRAVSTMNADRYFDETAATINDPAKTLFVDPLNGVDSDDCGAEHAKCRTLTKALSLAEAGGTVLLEPTAPYVFGSGTGAEPLPLQMKAGVAIHGTTQAGIAFLNFLDTQITGPAIVGADNAVLSGLRIEAHRSFGNILETQGTSPAIIDNLFLGACSLNSDNCISTAIFIDQASVPNISGNTFGDVEFGGFFEAVHVEGQANPELTDNTFIGNQTGLLAKGDAEPRLENNRILQNGEGVVLIENALPDLGGGAAASAGLNILSCNVAVDFFNDTFNTVFAQNNQWDHAPPENFSSPGDGVDIVFVGGFVNAENGTRYPFAPCNLGIRVSAPVPAFTTESGGSATFDLVLGTQPDADVVIDFSSSDVTEGTLSTGSLTFTPQNWDQSQSVTVTGEDDAVADGEQPYQVVFAPSVSSDLRYNNLSPAAIDLFNTDNDLPGITVSPNSGLVTTEAGGTDTFNVVLNSAPTQNVVIGLASDNANEGTPTPGSLTFTPVNWSTAQSVTVTGVDDAVADGDVNYDIVTTVTAGDAAYLAIDPDDVAVTNTDDDVVGITVSPTAGLTTTEAGSTATFTVVLDSEPTDAVSIALSSSDETEGTVLPLTLVFDATNWSTAQTVTVTGADDDVSDGSVAYQVLTAPALSADTNYSGQDASDVSLTNTDNDRVGITVTPTSGLTTTEAGGRARFSVVLDSEPTADVNVALSSSDPTEGAVSPGSLTFSPSNWNVAQNVDVTGLNDDVDDGDVAYTVLTAAATSADGNYNGIDAADVGLINTDDDTANIIVSAPSGPSTAEDGSTVTFSVVLATEPTAAVTVGLSSSDATEGQVSQSALVFSTTNWNVAQIVTVTGLDDFIVDGNVAYSIVTAEATSSDTNYSGLNASDVALSNTDNDVADIRVTPTSGLVTTEAGGTASFDVVLTSEPSADVSVPLSSNNVQEGTIAVTSLIFTAGDWNTPQNVIITGVDDAVQDGNVGYSIVTGAATSTDSDYSNVNADDVSVTNNDNDTAGVTVNPTAITTDEDGGTANFSVVLNTQPTADVTISLNVDDGTEAQLSTDGVIFTGINWNVSQSVTVTGLNDDVVDGNIAYTITTTATSSDANYNGVAVADVSGVNNDNDVAGINVTPTSGLVTTESGGTDTFDVVLTSQPTADVLIGLSSSDLSEGTVSSTSLTFTAANWSVAQPVTITGVNDDVDDGDITYTILTAAANSSDGNYNNRDVADVSVSNQDNDNAGITVSAAGLNTTEAGGSDAFTIVLNSEPTADVSIGLSSSDATEAALAVGSVIFTPGNWSVAQPVTVTGVDDDVDDGDVGFTIVTAAATSGDPNYNGVDAANVSGTNADDDTANIRVTPISGLVTNEDGGNATFRVVLESEPTADVTMGLSSDDLSEGTVSVPQLTFTASNWDMVRTVTVTGVNDFVVDGPQAYNILTAAATSTDANYNGLDAADVSVTNNDNDRAGFFVNPMSGLVTSEAGGSDTFTVVLTSEPAASVTIPLSSSDLSEGTVAPSSLVFDASDWNVAQTVTLTGADDLIDDGDQLYNALLDPVTSGDANYNGRDPSDVRATNTDNDTANVIVSPLSGLVTTEGGGTASFTVVLGTEPTASVSIGLESSDPGEGSPNTGSLDFDATNWDTLQTVIVTGVDDSFIDGNIAYSMLTSASSTDSAYDNFAVDDVSLTNNDNDTADIRVNPTSGLVTTEAGGTASFDVVLASQPSANVNIPLSSDDLTEGTISVSSLIFTSRNWNNPQTVIVTGVNDDVVDGNVAYSIVTGAATSADSDYNGFNADDVSVSNTDDDRVGIRVNPTSGLITSEAGVVDTFTVVLDSEPRADVSIGLSSSDRSEGDVSPASLIFTPLNWNTPQTVRVTGVNDAANDGNQVYFARTAAASSSDSAYNGLDANDVSVTNLEVVPRLTVRVVGNGTVTSVPTGINCAPTCEASFTDGQSVTLRTAIPANWRFENWSGDCSGTSSLTTVVMDRDKTCTATLKMTTLLRADFQGDSRGSPPDVLLPGDPEGDRLTLGTSAGTILVQQIILGSQTLKFAVLNQEAGLTGGLSLNGFVAGTPPSTGRYVVRWRASASTALFFASMVIRDSSGLILTNISYRPGGILDLNDQNPSGIGVSWSGSFQLFEVTVNLDTQMIDDILIDGQRPEVVFPLPFRQSSAVDLNRFSLETGGTAAQSFGLDDIEITLLP